MHVGSGRVSSLSIYMISLLGDLAGYRVTEHNARVWSIDFARWPMGDVTCVIKIFGLRVCVCCIPPPPGPPSAKITCLIRDRPKHRKDETGELLSSLCKYS